MKQFSKELVEKAMECKSAEELMSMAQAEGISMTKEEADVYFDAVSDDKITPEMLERCTGGTCYGNSCGHDLGCPSNTYCSAHSGSTPCGGHYCGSNC